MIVSGAIFDAAVDALEHGWRQGWSDGLPVVPPSPAYLAEFLAAAGEDGERVLFGIEAIDRVCTVRAAAACAAMAGCRPEWFPLVIAALEAIGDEGMPAKGAWQSTTGAAPLLVVNGPGRARLVAGGSGKPGGDGAEASRGCATVGRVAELVRLNVFGLHPGVLDQATHGTPGKAGLCIVENEEESPWPPLHVDLGYGAGETVVSAVHVRGFDVVESRGGGGRSLLRDLCGAASRSGALMTRDTQVCVVLAPAQAQRLASEGLSKEDVCAFIAAHSTRTSRELAAVGKDAVEEPLGWRRPGGAGLDEPAVGAPDRPRPVLASPADVLVVVAGSPGRAVASVAHRLGSTLGGARPSVGSSPVRSNTVRCADTEQAGREREKQMGGAS